MHKIEFYPNENFNPELVNNFLSKPIKASSVLPGWFKEIPRFQNDDKEMFADSTTGYHNLTVRHCMPFIDSITSGYLFTTWADIYVRRENDEVIISYEDLDLAEILGSGQIQYQKYFQSHIPQSPGYDSFSYAWSTYWRIKTPPGVSCLFTQPLNRTDLPFLTLAGITDTDKWHGSDVLNFALKKDFEGTIPRGTPFVQIIPFVREGFDFDILESAPESVSLQRSSVAMDRMQNKSGYYRDSLWEKKKF